MLQPLRQDVMAMLRDNRAPAVSGQVSLRLAPGQRFHGIANEIVNVAFLLTNKGQSRYFAISVQEFPSDQLRENNVVFPGQQQQQTNSAEFVPPPVRAPSPLTFLDRISEAKAYVLTNETLSLIHI